MQQKDFFYKSSPKASQFSHLYTDETDETDPPVEKVTKNARDFLDFKDSIFEAKDIFEKGHYNELTDIFNSWKDIINSLYKFITKSFLRETDFCIFLMKAASQNHSAMLQYSSIIAIAELMDKSEDSINEFIDSNGMFLFIQISNLNKQSHPNIKWTGYQILNFSLRTQKGVKAFIENGVIFGLFDSFREFLSHPEIFQDTSYLLNYAVAITTIFQNFLNHIDDKDIGKFPINAPETILKLLIHALTPNYKVFFQYTLASATLIVKHMKDEGNMIILKTEILDRIKDELNSGNEERMLLIIKLLSMIFSQNDNGIKTKLLKKIPYEYLIKQLNIYDINSNIFILLLNTICNFFICEMNVKWIIEPAYLTRFNLIFENASYESKEASSKCLMMATYFAPKEICTKLLDSNVLIPAIQFMLSITNNNNVKKMLRILCRMLEKICRHGLHHSSEFDNEVVNVLKSLNTDNDDNKISELTNYILKNYFPEIYYEE